MRGFGVQRLSQHEPLHGDLSQPGGEVDRASSLRAIVGTAPSGRRRNRLLERSLTALGDSRDPSTLKFVTEVAKDPASSAGVRTRAIDALRRSGPPASPYLRDLIRAGVIDAALPWALAETGTEHDADLLLPFLEQPGLRLRVNAVVALDHLGAPVSHEGFRLALRDRRLFVRASAMSALRERCSDAELLEALQAAKRDTPWYRLMARRYFTLWARRPKARESYRAKHPGVDDLSGPRR